MHGAPSDLGHAHDLAPLVVELDAVDVRVALLPLLPLAQRDARDLLWWRARGRWAPTSRLAGAHELMASAGMFLRLDASFTHHS